MSVASHDLFNMKLRTCIDTGQNHEHKDNEKNNLSFHNKTPNH